MKFRISNVRLAIVLIFFSVSMAKAQTTLVVSSNQQLSSSITGSQSSPITLIFKPTTENAKPKLTIPAGQTVYIQFSTESSANPINGSISNYGTTNILNSFTVKGQIDLENFSGGDLTLNNLSQGDQSLLNITNDAGGNITIKNEINLHRNAILKNSGTITQINGNSTIENGSTVSNSGNLVMSGNLVIDGTFNNSGFIKTAGNINVNSDANVTNDCRFYSQGTGNQSILIAAPFINNGFLFAPNGGIDNNAQSNGFTNGDNGILRCLNLDNDATLKGGGYIYIEGSNNILNRNIEGTSQSMQVYSESNAIDASKLRGTAKLVKSMTDYNMDNTAELYNTCPNYIIPRSLPITLSNFSGDYNDNSTKLQWITATEINAKSYDIERSSDGSIWSNIGTVAARNESNQNYTYTDYQPNSGKNLYRLKMVDLDGSYKYSGIIEVDIKNSNVGNNLNVKIYPNPVSQGQNMNIQIQSASNQNIAIRVINMLGQTEFTQQKSILGGQNAISISSNTMTKGVNFVIIYDSKGTILGKQKVIIL